MKFPNKVEFCLAMVSRLINVWRVCWNRFTFLVLYSLNLAAKGDNNIIAAAQLAYSGVNSNTLSRRPAKIIMILFFFGGLIYGLLCTDNFMFHIG